MNISECGVKLLDQVSFIRDSGKNIFVRGRFEISGNRSEIFERGVKFMGQVSFIGDSGENIFFGDRFEIFGIVWKFPSVA